MVITRLVDGLEVNRLVTVRLSSACLRSLLNQFQDTEDVHSIYFAPSSFYIAVFTAIGNLSLRYAALQGVTVLWWITALKGYDIDGREPPIGLRNVLTVAFF